MFLTCYTRRVLSRLHRTYQGSMVGPYRVLSPSLRSNLAALGQHTASMMLGLESAGDEGPVERRIPDLELRSAS
jgi:hypothetical protein